MATKADKTGTVEGSTYKATVKTGAIEQPKPVNSEQAYFNKVSGGHDPNRLENPYPTGMTYVQAVKIIEEKYKDFKGAEAPLDLQQARSIVKSVNPT